MTLLAGKPKKGKTWMALDIAVAVAAPRICLGDFVPVHGDVLYIALEDNPRRLQRRLKHILVHDDEAWPERLTFAFNWRRLNEGGVDDLAEWLDEHSEARLIVIDTFAAVRALSKDYGYNEDYSALAGLQRFAGERGIAVLVVHHLRKAGADDFGDEISGTLGLTAAVDGYLVLRGDGNDVELCLRSRDIEERKYGATFNKETCRWTLDRSSEHDRSKDRILARAARGRGAALAGRDRAAVGAQPEHRRHPASSHAPERRSAPGEQPLQPGRDGVTIDVRCLSDAQTLMAQGFEADISQKSPP